MTIPAPAETFPPGHFIREELEARNWTQQDLAEILGRTASTISLIVTGKKRITPRMAVELGQAFGTGPKLWLNLESKYRLSKLTKTDGSVTRRARLKECRDLRRYVNIAHGEVKP